MKVFLDANVLFAAAYNPAGLCAALFRLAASGRCVLAASAFVVDEAKRNLLLKAPGKAAGLGSLLEQIALVQEPPKAVVERLTPYAVDDKDAPVLAAAVAAGCDLLVTGDRRHFGSLYGKAVLGVRVVPPADAFDVLLPQ